ncbi:hypothetical protein BO83DRAFT_171423 [Aspergillus eucalypticola CBS 122712]|uniref:Uncharacterized protein n=1 Tax=Aspergillus eucalypticola (strain CBS 122712 / IBT 29274) TaxID=1448314 RepID=A0A317WAQ6_ASPEC|nr:uncharacterized protein BO83DRAFT_171423 [Aspergillus eucalypticola CBS 122712]PWY81190.1 hypothetical protein BO83DRAFT_171423 [Aspergillus eucalypticola CBS 122712]
MLHLCLPNEGPTLQEETMIKERLPACSQQRFRACALAITYIQAVALHIILYERHTYFRTYPATGVPDNHC